MADDLEESFWLNEFFDVEDQHISGSYSHEAKEQLVKYFILAGVFDYLFIDHEDKLQPKRFRREGNKFKLIYLIRKLQIAI